MKFIYQIIIFLKKNNYAIVFFKIKNNYTKIRIIVSIVDIQYKKHTKTNIEQQLPHKLYIWRSDKKKNKLENLSDGHLIILCSQIWSELISKFGNLVLGGIL